VPVAETFVLDTSALLTFIEDEPGADQVQAALFEAAAGRSQLYACFVSLTEVQYITLQEREIRLRSSEWLIFENYQFNGSTLTMNYAPLRQS
jgi:PIN domain nuclease of toxin-antitoxin system